jgi:peptidylprolyl isomerase
VGKLLLGEAGTEVTLTVIPYGQEDLTSPKSYTLRRETYSVKAKVQAPIMTEGGGGLYSGPSGPKPPAALYLALDGMRVGSLTKCYTFVTQ